jgi:hypothetical protein
VHCDSIDGTVGGFFQFGNRIVSVTAAHVVPTIDSRYKVKEEDVAFIDM